MYAYSTIKIYASLITREPFLQFCTTRPRIMEVSVNEMGTQERTKHPSRRVLLAKIKEAVGELKSDDPQVSFDAARRLADLDSKAATRSVLEVAKGGPNEHSRRFAVYVLRSLADKRSEKAIVDLLGSQAEPDSVRDEAAEALSVFVEKGSPIAGSVIGAT